MPPTLKREDDQLTLSLSGAEDFQGALAIVRAVPGRKFDGDRKVWCFPNEPAIAERLMLSIKPTADAAVTQWVQNSRVERDRELTTPLPDDAELHVPWAHRLFDYQRSVADFIAENPRMILADDMGIGKTVEAITGIAEHSVRHRKEKAHRPLLVVAPNSAKGVWKRELNKWLSDPRVALIDAKTPKGRQEQLEQGIKDYAWVVVNWEQVRASKQKEEITVNHRDGSSSVREHYHWEPKQPLFRDTEWLAVVADECHRAKNHKAQVSRGLWMIDAPIKLALSGTPLMNHPAELWSVLRWLYPEQYHEKGRKHNGVAWAYWPFYDEYVDDYEVPGRGRVIVGVKNPDALRFELKDRLVRRTKGELLDLPEKVRETVPVKLNPKQQKAYEAAESDFWLEIEQAIEEGDKQAAKFAEDVLAGKKRIFELSNGAARTVRLRQIASTPALLGGEDDSAKLDAVVEIITDAGDKPFVVFTEFVGTANILVNRLRSKKIAAEAYTGEVTDTRQRTLYEDRFQAGEIQVLVGTIGAMRESITLTAADTVIFVERAWVPGWNEQAEDRLWRTGQKNQVTVLILEAEGTVDEDKVRPTNQAKERIVASIIKKDEVREVA